MSNGTKEIDHRTRVGIARRRKMRMRLFEAALTVCDEKGLENAVIEDVITAAGVSRGSFYNYFQTMDELLAALGTELGNELVDTVENAVEDYPDPVQRLASGLRVFLHAVLSRPRVARLLWRAGFNAVNPTHLVYAYLPRHIEEGMRQGRIVAGDVATALEISAGIALTTIYASSTREVAEDYPEQMVRHILLALGVRKRDIARLLKCPLPAIELPAQSLLDGVSARG